MRTLRPGQGENGPQGTSRGGLDARAHVPLPGMPAALHSARPPAALPSARPPPCPLRARCLALCAPARRLALCAPAVPGAEQTLPLLLLSRSGAQCGASLRGWLHLTSAGLVLGSWHVAPRFSAREPRFDDSGTCGLRGCQPAPARRGEGCGSGAGGWLLAPPSALCLSPSLLFFLLETRSNCEVRSSPDSGQRGPWPGRPPTHAHLVSGPRASPSRVGAGRGTACLRENREEATRETREVGEGVPPPPRGRGPAACATDHLMPRRVAIRGIY